MYGDASFHAVAVVDDHLIVAGDSLGDVWLIEWPESARRPLAPILA